MASQHRIIPGDSLVAACHVAGKSKGIDPPGLPRETHWDAYLRSDSVFDIYFFQIKDAKTNTSFSIL